MDFDSRPYVTTGQHYRATCDVLSCTVSEI